MILDNMSIGLFYCIIFTIYTRLYAFIIVCDDLSISPYIMHIVMHVLVLVSFFVITFNYLWFNFRPIHLHCCNNVEHA